ncbi:glucose 1-dehydrogenase [Alternaria burnsii]|uniref:Glucose 1-dehydrogenase n=1 Tax=Alternaria burnsii TaxID=1187904 RepID=A0A8H7BAT0_9PLEO|nr:glucose 1-dehydrogenase [Alternaria burnsii]KAF7677780.1 glucose 1-dehydrogenase [Alternaria burnsii]
MPKRVLCLYGIDIDAVSNNMLRLNTKTDAPANPTGVSRGVFGATVGIDRLLKLFDKYNIKATWFTPAHTADVFPKQIRKIVEKGHEIGLHGYTHESVSLLSEEQQRDVLEKSIQVLENIEYDHSFMHHDSQPYYVPSPHHVTYTETDLSKPTSHWMTPMSTLKPSAVVEIPANWHLDDWPPFQLSLMQPSTHGFLDTAVIERLWKEQFEFLYRGCPNDRSFILPISIHPQVSGKPQVILLHERLIEWINGHQGVEWVTFGVTVDESKSGKLSGATVEGGADV